MRRVAVITGASRRIVRRPHESSRGGGRAAARIKVTTRPWWLARQVVAEQRGRLRVETPETVPTRHEEVDSPIRSKVMDADRDSSAPRPEISAHVASCVIRVRELDPSLKFYCTCSRAMSAVREADMALLVAPNGFHIYLHAPSRRGRAANTAGVQHLLWATGTESDLQEFAQRLRAYDPAVFSHTENGVTVIDRIRPRPRAGPHPTHRDSSAPACLTAATEAGHPTGSTLPPTAAAI